MRTKPAKNIRVESKGVELLRSLSLIVPASLFFLGTATVTVAQAGFRLTGSMATARERHTATLLPLSGKVLIAGGFGNGSIRPFTTAELYDPTIETFTNTGTLSIERDLHTATLLQDGRVLMVGGFTRAEASGITSSSELYDPVTGSFMPSGSMSVARAGHTATLLLDGRVLITGGRDTASRATAELYDPTTGSFTSTGDMGEARDAHTATLLPNGKVLIAGGVNRDPPSYVVSATAELYDPTTGSFTPAGTMTRARVWHTATLLTNGQVLLAGEDASAELYDPDTGSFTPTGSMTLGILHTATLLPNGKVLAVSFNRANAELYDPDTGTFTPTGSMSTLRRWHSATSLGDGTVLVAGGDDDSDPDNPSPLASAEIYQEGFGEDSGNPENPKSRALESRAETR